MANNNIFLGKAKAVQQSALDIIDVYFTGTYVKLQRGQPLCWENHAAGGTAWDTTRDGFGWKVSLPEHAVDMQLFAGVVADDCAGKQGPCWIRLVRPQSGNMLEVLVHAGASIAAGALLAFGSVGGSTAAGSTSYNTTTTGWGGFNVFAANAGYTGSGATLWSAVTEMLPQMKAVLLASLASTANSRALRWVKFI